MSISKGNQGPPRISPAGTKRVNARVGIDDVSDLELAAAEAGISVSEAVRESIRQYTAKQFKTAAAVESIRQLST